MQRSNTLDYNHTCERNHDDNYYFRQVVRVSRVQRPSERGTEKGALGEINFIIRKKKLDYEKLSFWLFGHKVNDGVVLVTVAVVAAALLPFWPNSAVMPSSWLSDSSRLGVLCLGFKM